MATSSSSVYPMNLEPPPYPGDGYDESGYKPADQPQQTTVIYVTSNEPVAVDSEAMAGSSFSERKIRHAFIRKVYLLLLVQLSITVGFICLFLFCTPVQRWVQTNSWFYWTSYGVFVVTYITLACCPAVRRRVPVNFICLLIFTLAFSYMAATISSYYDTVIVLVCIGITAGLCLGITLFAVQTKIDFTMCSGLLFALILVLVYTGFTCLIFYLCGYYYYANCVYGALAALVFSLFLVYDTQLVVGGKHRRYELSPEDYITGALELYLDIVNLLLILVSLIGNGNS